MTHDSIPFRLLLYYGLRFPGHPRKWWLHQRLRDLFGPAVDAEFDVKRGGLRWRLNPADFVHTSLFWLGTNDHWEIEEICRRLTPGCVILDVGANFGYYGLKIATHLRKQCQVHSFEPDPSNFARLEHHIKVNGMTGVVVPHHCGLADQIGFAHLKARHGNSGSANLDVSPDASGIPLTTVDDFVTGQQIERIDFIKIDVEGFEERVLRGGRDTLARFHPLILIELEPPRLALKGSSVVAVADLLKKAGYRLFVCHRDRLVPLRELPKRDDEQINAFAIAC